MILAVFTIMGIIALALGLAACFPRIVSHFTRHDGEDPDFWGKQDPEKHIWGKRDLEE